MSYGRTNSRVDIDHDDLILTFPKDYDLIKELKLIPGAKWDLNNRVWRVPMTQVNAVRNYAVEHKFRVAMDVAKFFTPTHPIKASMEVVSGHLEIRFEYDELMIAVLKDAVPGVVWRGKTKTRLEPCWEAPIGALDHALTWAKRFKVPIGDSVCAAVTDRDALHWAMEDASHSGGYDLPPIEGLGHELYPFQRAGVYYATLARRCLIGDSPGLGKTAQALATLHVLGAFPALVVCPPTLVLKWANQVEMWLPGRTVSTITGRKDSLEPADITIVGWSNLATYADVLRKKKFPGVIFDEIHYAKNPTAQRSKAALKIGKSVPSDGAVVVLGLTGTPMSGKPVELIHQLQVLGRLDEFIDKQYMEDRFCDAHFDDAGYRQVDGHSNDEELHVLLRRSVMVRRTTEEVIGELPLRFDPVPVEGDPKVMKEYAKAEADIARYMAEKAAKIAAELGEDIKSAAVRARMKAQSAETLVMMSQLRQIAARAKIPAVKEWVAARNEAGAKVILAAHHRDIVDELANTFGGLKVQGSMSVKDVQAAVERFQATTCTEVPTITLSIEAAKEGHDLTAAHDVAFVEFPWTFIAMQQTIGRAFGRLNDPHGVLATCFVILGSIDEKLYNLCRGKGVVSGMVLDGIMDDAKSMPELPSEDDVVTDLVMDLVAQGQQLALGV